MERHYQTYREGVQADAMPGFAEYAAKSRTADPRLYPTVLDYLKHSTNKIKEAVAEKNMDDYLQWLGYHQEAALALFRRMFNEQLDRSKDRPAATLDLVHRYGWRSFKFSDIVINFDKLHIIPRYSTAVKQYIYGDLPCFSADEMALVTAAQPDEDVVQEILDNKREYKSYLVGVTKTEWSAVDLASRNKDVVYDWSGRLQ